MRTEAAARSLHKERGSARDVPPTPARGLPNPILQLQRMAGNRAAVEAIQRKFGFEAELDVNTYGAEGGGEIKGFNQGPGGACPAGVISFLTRGFAHDTEFGRNKHFILKADHGPDSPAATVFDALTERKLAPVRKEVLAKAGAPSNLEYASLPIEELDAGSNASLKAQTDAVQAHVKAIFDQHPETDSLPLPAPATIGRTGIPVAALRQWLGPEFKDNDSLLRDARQSLRQRLTLQVTAGIIPSALPELYGASAGADVKYAPELQKVGRVHDRMAKAIHKDVGEVLDSVKDDLFIRELKASRTEYEAFAGLLYLGYSYLVGHAVNQTDVFGTSSEKNAVPFLLQMLIGQDENLKPVMPQGLRSKAIPKDLLATIAEALGKRDAVSTEYWMKSEGLQRPRQRSPLLSRGGEEASSFIPGMFADEAYWLFPPIGKLAGDVQPKPVQAASDQQVGLPLERRLVATLPSPDQLFATLLPFLEEARTLNAKHLAGKDAQKLLRAARAPAPAASNCWGCCLPWCAPSSDLKDKP